MLAVLLREFTDKPETVAASEVPKPAPGAGEVLVAIEAAAINPSDLVNMRGGFSHTKLPRVIGRDFAGRVVKGPPHLQAREVFGSGGGELGYTRDGTHAQFLALPEDAIALRPAALSVEQAASAGVPFVTAWHALVERANITRDAWVLISGAAGAVGTAATQISHYAGAHVIALIKDASETELLDRTKISAVASSNAGDLEEVVRKATGGNGCDIALNTVGSPIFPALLSSLRKHGRMVVISAVAGREVTLDLRNFYRSELTLIGVDSASLSASESARMLTEMTAAFESGQIKPPQVSARFPLEHANLAYEAAAKPNSKVVFAVA